jgi:hypothetical protein
MITGTSQRPQKFLKLTFKFLLCIIVWRIRTFEVLRYWYSLSFIRYGNPAASAVWKKYSRERDACYKLPIVLLTLFCFVFLQQSRDPLILKTQKIPRPNMGRDSPLHRQAPIIIRIFTENLKPNLHIQTLQVGSGKRVTGQLEWPVGPESRSGIYFFGSANEE